jgi:hypothetical protein
MTGSAEIDVVAAITAPHKAGEVVPSLGPLVKYLREGGEVTSYLRDVLADLLDVDSTHALKLELVRRDSRYMRPVEEVERDANAYLRVQELTNAAPTGKLIQNILQHLPDWECKTQRSSFLLQRSGVTELRIPINKPISKTLAIRIASFQVHKHFETVKKMVEKTQADLQE